MFLLLYEPDLVKTSSREPEKNDKEKLRRKRDFKKTCDIKGEGVYCRAPDIGRPKQSYQ